MGIKRITITSEDFKSSKYFSNADCAFAKALKRRYPDRAIFVCISHFKIGGIGYAIPNHCVEELRTRCETTDEPLPMRIQFNEKN